MTTKEIPVINFISNEDRKNATSIVLPGSAFFNQELGSIIFDKLMKAPVKDYQVLLRLTKLGKTINENSHALSQLRDEAAKECGLGDFLSQDATLTPETLQSEDYQEKTKKFGTTLQEKIFDKWINLEPLGHLTLNLTSPDGHARAFLEGSNLSADDIAMLTDFGIIDVVYPEDILPANKPEKDDTTNA